jgi:hypothetical protein
MSSGTGQDPSQFEGDNTSAEQDIEGAGGEGARAANVTPSIADEGEQEQTTVPAPDEDAGSAFG